MYASEYSVRAFTFQETNEDKDRMVRGKGDDKG